MVNVPYKVLENNNQRDNTADVSRNGKWDQGTKVPDKGQQNCGKKQNCHPRFDVKSVGDLRGKIFTYINNWMNKQMGE